MIMADPYAFHAETRPGTASRYYDISGYKWNDGRWFEHKKKYPHYNQPVNIYEMHAGLLAQICRTAACSLNEQAR